MRVRGRQSRFLLGTLGLWIVGRAAMLVPWPDRLARRRGVSVATAPQPMPRRTGPPVAPLRARPAGAPPGAGPPRMMLAVATVRPGRAIAPALPARAAAPLPAPSAWLAPFVPAPDAAPASSMPRPMPARPAGAPRWTASATLFVRPGSQAASLAAGGMLGGSQLAARLTYRLDPAGPPGTALAMRLYAPLAGAGREAAAGLDWQPLPAVPLRLSVERRVALDRAGRNAWSAYAAGGFYRAPLPGVVVDGYAQAGLVGARRRDLFVDGAMRAGRRLGLGRATAVVGAGLWGAAQPGVARLDLGPRLAVSGPLAAHTISVAVEGRLRLAGRARPGSGAALTLGVDL